MNKYCGLCNLEIARKKSENTTGISASNAINSQLLTIGGGSSGGPGSLNIPINRFSSANLNLTVPTKMALLPVEQNLTCRIGDNQCRAVFRGAPWSFKTESSLLSPSKKICFFIFLEYKKYFLMV